MFGGGSSFGGDTDWLDLEHGWGSLEEAGAGIPAEGGTQLPNES